MATKMTYEERKAIEAIPVQKRTIAQLRLTLDYQLRMVDYGKRILTSFEGEANVVKAELSRRRVPIYGEGVTVTRKKRPKLKLVKK